MATILTAQERALRKDPPKNCVVIPLRGTVDDESIEINFEDLPDGDEVLQILRAEKAFLHYWIRLGLEYYRRGHYEIFVRLLENSGSEASLEYEDVSNDQMKALDILAAYFVRLAHRERGNKEKKRDLFAKATLLYTTADKLKMYDTDHLTGRAYFCLVEGKQNKLDSAAQQFNFVLKQNSNDIAAMMGMACISFNKKEYSTALYYYKKCLRQKPIGPADFRVGIGYCLARMNKLEKARLAFERALEILPTHVSALTALAIMDLNEYSEESLQLAVKRLSAAYKLEPENPVVLVHLANHFFYREDRERSEQLAWHAMSIAESDQIRAEACFQLARCFHCNLDYDKAFKYYYQATTLNHPSFILPYYGLGQLHIQRGEFNQAIHAFENILKVHPNNTETLKVVGSLYAHSEGENAEKRQKAREAFTKYLASYPDDIEVLIDMAQLLEYVDPQKSLAYYEHAVDLLGKEEIDSPSEIMNNMGSLHMHLGNFKQALECYADAEHRLLMENAMETSDGQNVLLTIRYNKGRCYEHMCLFDDAAEIYKGILKIREDYIDCMIRLGCLARDRGQIYDASVQFKEAMSINPGHADAWTLIGNLHMAKHEWGPAQKKFEHILKLGDLKHDAYSHIALGNIWLESLFNPMRDRRNDEKYMDRAISMFAKAIKIQPKNMWGANGLGCVLALKKQWLEARDIFTQVREATAEFFDVWVNIAHVYMETRQYVPAIQMYVNAMKKFGKENDSLMLMYLARAYFRANKLLDGRETLERAIFEAPDNVQIKFNHAFILKKMAKDTLADVKSTTTMVNGAIDDLRTAERVLTYISNNKDDTLSGARYVSRTAAGEEARECRDLLKQAQTYLARAQLQDEEESRLRAKQEEERLSLLRKMQEEQQEKEAERLRKEDELRSLRHTYVSMTKDILKMPEIVEEKKSRGYGKKRKGGDGDEFVNDSSDMGDWQNGEEGGEKRERKKKDKESKKGERKRREKRIKRGSGSDDGEDKKAAKRRKRKEAAARKAAEKQAKNNPKIKSRQFLSSEDDDSDSDKKSPKSDEPSTMHVPDSPPPPVPSSDDSDDSVPKPRKKKAAVDSDSSDEGSNASPANIRSNDDDEGDLEDKGSQSDAASSSNSDSD
ncbi:unnamed protein product [Auanema sp. JU1783]|nr:unnamed protein product [Auanema sp. JU1783]